MNVSPALLVAPAPGLRLPWRDRCPSMEMAGGTQPELLAAALAEVPGWVKSRI